MAFVKHQWEHSLAIPVLNNTETTNTGWFWIPFSNIRTQRPSLRPVLAAHSSPVSGPVPQPWGGNRVRFPTQEPAGPACPRELRAPSAARPQREPSRAGPRRSSPASPADQSAPGSAKRTNGEARGAGTAGAAGQWRAAGGGHCGPSARPAGAPSERGRCLGTASCPWLRPLVRNHFCAHTEITGHDLLN